MSLKKGTIAIAITAAFGAAQAEFVAIQLGTGGATYNVVSDNPAGESSIIVGGGQFVEATPNNGGETEPTEPVDDGVATITCQSGDANYITRSELETMIGNEDDVTGVCTSGITDFSNLFNGKLTFNQNISRWDVSNGTDFTRMFLNARAFNQNIGGWNVSNVQSFSSMFENAKVFNQDISGWDVSSGTDFSHMFKEAVSFNKDIGSWVVSNGGSFNYMFASASLFNQDISGWNTVSAVSWYDFKTDSALTKTNTPRKFL